MAAPLLLVDTTGRLAQLLLMISSVALLLLLLLLLEEREGGPLARHRGSRRKGDGRERWSRIALKAVFRAVMMERVDLWGESWRQSSSTVPHVAIPHASSGRAGSAGLRAQMSWVGGAQLRAASDSTGRAASVPTIVDPAVVPHRIAE